MEDTWKEHSVEDVDAEITDLKQKEEEYKLEGCQ